MSYMDSDRFAISRADGYLPQVVFSLPAQQRQKIAKKGSYERALFGALFGRVLPPEANMFTWLPPIEEDDPFAKRELNETNIIRKLCQRIPTSPAVTLDLPDISDDYYSHSVALRGKNAAVLLGSDCYVVLDIALSTRCVKKIYTHQDSFGLACIEWLNDTTLAVGRKRSSSLYLIDVNNLREPKSQEALHHLALGQVTRITRLTDTVFLSGYTNGEVVYNDVSTGESRSLLGMRRSPEMICNIVLSNRATHVALGYNDGTVCVYQLIAQKTLSLVRSYESTSPAGKRALAFLPESETQFISGGGIADPVLRLFTIHEQNPISSYKLPAAITNIVFTDKRQFVATYGNRIGHFILLKNTITLIKEVVTSSDKRLLDAVYSPETGLITSSAGEFLYIWPLMPAQKSESTLSKIVLNEIR